MNSRRLLSFLIKAEAEGLRVFMILVVTTTILLQSLQTTTTTTSALSISMSSSKNQDANQKQQQSQRNTIFPNSIPIKDSDVEIFKRQTGQVKPSLAAIGIPSFCRCQHGFPQVFALDSHHNGRMNSGLLKLTCPYLVRAVDTLEDQGMIHNINQRILIKQQLEEEEGAKDDDDDDGCTSSSSSSSSSTTTTTTTTTTTLEESMTNAHKRHATIRKQMLTHHDIDEIQSKLGKKGTESFLNSGVAGTTIGSKDCKCLHAWLADYLFFDTIDDDKKEEEEENPPSSSSSTLLVTVGDIVREELEKQYNIYLNGTSTCHVLCDPKSSTYMANPPKPRNKQRLRTGKEIQRRKRQKQKQNKKDDRENII